MYGFLLCTRITIPLVSYASTHLAKYISTAYVLCNITTGRDDDLSAWVILKTSLRLEHTIPRKRANQEHSSEEWVV
jgi:hypothetical protein